MATSQKESGRDDPLKYGCVFSLLFGVVGFTLGYCSPMYLGPDATMAPILGCMTGPLGFVLGFLGGHMLGTRIEEKRERLQRPGVCSSCGYDLRGQTKTNARCPECGEERCRG